MPAGTPAGTNHAIVPDAEPGALAPIGERDRIVALDVLRGFALLGIFCVNMQFFARPFADLIGPVGGDDATNGEHVAWFFIKAFCEYKFITLFSLLFGVGLAMQLMRATSAGRPFLWLALRRLLVLAVFGVAHALGLWFGDILFIYACGGLVLVPLIGLRPKILLAVGGSLFLAVGIVMTGFASLQVIGATFSDAADTATTVVVVGEDVTATPESTDVDPGPVEVATEPEPEKADEESHADALRRAPFGTVGRLVAATAPKGLMFSDRWGEVELVAYGEGPFLGAVAMRAVTWGIITLQGAISFGWRVVAVFVVGAGLMKLGFFGPEWRRWHVRLFAVALPLGVALEGAYAWILPSTAFGASFTWVLAESLHYFGSAVLCAGYVGAVLCLAAGPRPNPVVRMLAPVGRLALTNYLMQTILTTFVMYWWGLGLFGTFGRPAQLALVAAIFVVQIVLSVLWMRWFRMGPFEWLWRSCTYLRPQRILRGSRRG